MNALLQAAEEVCHFFAEQGWSFCIIGGLAVQRWGEPRTTLDADLTLLAGWGEEERFARAILGRFASRIPDGLSFAVERRVLLLRSSGGKDVDVSLGGLPFEAQMVRRAMPVEFAPGCTLPCCTAEDLFVMKAFAARPRDWLDAESIVSRKPGLDSAYIIENLRELCDLKGDPEILRRAESLLGGGP